MAEPSNDLGGGHTAPPEPPGRSRLVGVPTRLRRSADFTRVQSEGRRLRGAHLQVVYAAGGAAGSRCGFAVSKKVGNAVVRNRVKRWLREVLLVVGGLLPARPLDLVLIARPGAGDAGLAALRSEVGDLFAKVA